MSPLHGLCQTLPNKPHRRREPLRFVSCLVRYPCSCCCLTMFVAVLTSIAGLRTLIANSTDGIPFKIGVDYPNFDIIAKNSDALSLAVEESSVALLGVSAGVSSTAGGFGRRLSIGAEVAHSMKSLSTQPQSTPRKLSESAAAQPEQSVVMARTLLVVSARDGIDNVLDDDGLEQLCRFRFGLTRDEPTWPSYCLLRANSSGATSCAPGNDALPLFYGDASYDIDQLDLSDFNVAGFDAIATALVNQDLPTLATFPPADVATVNVLVQKLNGYLIGPWQNSKHICNPAQKKDVAKVLDVLARVKEAESLSAFSQLLNQFVDTGFTVANPVTKHTKGLYLYGAPFSDWTNYIDSTAVAEQDSAFRQWWSTSEFRSLYPEGPSTSWPTGQPTVLNTQLLLDEILLVLIDDGIRAILPFILVFIIVWLHTHSALVAAGTMFEIIISLTGAIFITCNILQIKWLSVQSALAGFIVLAIGADDVFVFIDAYKQSFYRGADVNQTFVHRMSWVYRRAGMAMLITSVTTCSAFLASALSSPIPELQNFGIFAACVIFVDYVLVMTFMCANTILYHNWFEMKPGLCCACVQKGGCEYACACDEARLASDRSTCKAATHTQVAGEKPFAARLFEDVFPFNLIVQSPIRRGASIVLCLAFLVAALFSAVRFEPQTSNENILPDWHPFQRYFNVQGEFEPSNIDNTVEINIVWGLKEDEPLDQSGVNLIFDADFKGVPQYDPSFAMTPGAQTAMLSACDVLDAAEATRKELNTVTGELTVLTSCFIRAFKQYRESRGEVFPVATSSEAATTIEAWLLNTSSTAMSQDFVNDVGWVRVDGVLSLAWAKVRAQSNLAENSRLPAMQLRVYFQEWQQIVTEQIASITSSTALGTPFQVAGLETGRDNKWIYMVIQEAYIQMALTGAGVGLGIAAIVLLFSTGNLIVTSVSMFAIGSTIACVLGTIVAIGWQLGSNESLAIMVLTGFAVDYVVHLSHAYMESPSLTRLERVHDALRDLGISVFWGMLTSLIAAGILVSCSLQFLHKFGVCFALTISYAYLWSVLFVMPLLAFVGPQPSSGTHVEGDAVSPQRETPQVANADV